MDRRLAAEPILGLLFACEMAVRVLGRMLRVDQKVDDFARPGDDPVVAAAKQLLNQCELFLAALDDYRVHLDERRHRMAHVEDWPF